jgi:hypothetical protein
MTLVRPNAILTVAGRALSAAEAGLVRLRAQLSVGEAHDHVELFCWPASKLASASAGATLAVSLGPKDSEVDVLTGEVEAVRVSADAVVLEGMDASIALSRSFVGQSFLELSIADIVNQLASDAGMDTEEVSCDISLPAYAIDPRRSVWSHLNDLARLAGADLAVTAAGALRFVIPGEAGGGGGLGGAVGAVAGALGLGGASGLRYGANVLAWHASTAQDAPSASIAAYGAASEAGSSKWHWILREPSFAGDGAPRVLAALRTRDAAEAVETAWTARATRARLRGMLRIVGDASIRPGDTITVSDLPSGDPGSLHVLAVEHLLDGGDGFITTLTVEAAS